MRKIIILLLSIISFGTRASVVVTSFDEIKSLHTALDEKPIYLNKFLSNPKIKREDLGKPTSPFYIENNLVKRTYQDFLKNCYEIKFFENSISAFKINCHIKRNFKVIFDNEVYESTTNFNVSNENVFLFDGVTFNKKIEAFHHQQENYVDSPDVEMPFSIVNLSVNAHKAISFNNDNITIHSAIEITRAPYAFLSSKNEMMTQDLKVEPKKGDMIFRNGERFILLKRYQPRPLNFRALFVSRDYLNYLNYIEMNFFDHNDKKRCFRDNFLTPLQFDCDYLIFKNKGFGDFREFDFIFVDYGNKRVQFL